MLLYIIIKITQKREGNSSMIIVTTSDKTYYVQVTRGQCCSCRVERHQTITVLFLPEFWNGWAQRDTRTSGHKGLKLGAPDESRSSALGHEPVCCTPALERGSMCFGHSQNDSASVAMTQTHRLGSLILELQGTKWYYKLPVHFTSPFLLLTNSNGQRGCAPGFPE